MSEKQAAYRVLARKYRPQNFDELIGQDALVRTLSNAIESGRVAHAFMLTGVRGVGKTTTARIIAKALNYKDGPTVGPTDDCDICKAISQDRHPDVIEMDAASNTGVENIREILDGIRYAPSEARYKVYVIDEVHMLSKSAFNALLKTLEEPPEHVKFIFATTEIRKVPITVLSRCQRFDLRRVDIPTLSAHFVSICEQEGVKIDDVAVAMIARAADGSVRDGLSILDQAMALNSELITAETVEDMLGLADRARSMDLLEHALSGNMPESLEIMDDLYRSGADPLVMMQDLLDLSHMLTKLRAVPEAKDMKQGMTQDQVNRAADMAAQLSMPTLAKTWQILLKGLSEVQLAPNPQSAAEMVLIRLAYAADLPDPAELLKTLKDNPAPAASTSAASVSAEPPQSAPTSRSSAGPSGGVSAPASVEIPKGGSRGGSEMAALATSLEIVPDSDPMVIPQIKTLEDVVQVLEIGGEILLSSQVYQFAHLVKLEEGRLEIRPEEEALPKFTQDLGAALSRITGNRWMVSVSGAAGQPTLAEKADAALSAEREQVLNTPIMKEVLAVFPDAELRGIKYIQDQEG